MHVHVQSMTYCMCWAALFRRTGKGSVVIGDKRVKGLCSKKEENWGDAGM